MMHHTVAMPELCSWIPSYPCRHTADGNNLLLVDSLVYTQWGMMFACSLISICAEKGTCVLTVFKSTRTSDLLCSVSTLIGLITMSSHLCFHLHNHHCQINCYLSLFLNHPPWLPSGISSFHGTCDAYVVCFPYSSLHGACHGILLLLCIWCFLPLLLRGIPL